MDFLPVYHGIRASGLRQLPDGFEWIADFPGNVRMDFQVEFALRQARQQHRLRDDPDRTADPYFLEESGGGFRGSLARAGSCRGAVRSG